MTYEQRIKISGRLVTQTPRAFLYEDEKAGEVWIPRSQATAIVTDGRTIEFEIPLWLAKKNGLV